MNANQFIDWIVGDCISISDPEFMARLFVVLIVLTFSTAIFKQLTDTMR